MTGCKICGEINIGPEHEVSPNHIKNKVLCEYSQNKKQSYGNRKGAVVSCSVKSSSTNIVDFVDAKIKVSAKPEEELLFKFTISNETKKDDIILNCIETAHNKFNFVLNNHGLSYGCNPVTIKPKQKLQKDVSVKFKCLNIGQYQVPIIFSFKKPGTAETIIIVRDMVVYVETQPRVHEHIVSPYAQKEVTANKLYKTSMPEDSDDLYRIPKKYKTIFASGLKIKEEISPEDKEIFNDVKEILTTGVTEDNYIRFFHNLLWYEETIVRINLKKYNMSGVPLRRQGVDAYALMVPGLAEKRPSLMIGDIIFVKPHNNEEVMFEAVVTDMNGENSVNIRGLHSAFTKYYAQAALFDVRFFMSRMPLERMHRAVHASAATAQARVFPQTNPKQPQRKRILNYYNQLVEQNPEQRLAVESIVAVTAGVAPYLLHGPPGTGKTVTIVETVLQLVTANPKNRILVCTDSNMAADHVATMLAQYKPMFADDKLLLRACSRFRVWGTLPESLHEYSNGTNYNDFWPVTIEEFKKYKIVITTLSHAAKFARELKRKRMQRPITHLFIDEAAQASEPSALIPMTGLLADGGALTLAGDPLQLGPVVISHHARRLGLGLSLMERLKNTCDLYSVERSDPDYTLMLRNNFRSDPAVLQIPNELFYRGQLRAQAPPDPLSNVDILGERAACRAIVFHGVLSKEQRMGKSPSYYNNLELEIVIKYVTVLLKNHNVLPSDIGVVTPYIRQVYKVKNALSALGGGAGGVEVGTVEAFQGKEKRVILVSTVRANASLLDHDAKFQLGFLVDDKRFNVALTRAKAKAIVIGNPLCLEKDAKWRAYIQKCRELGTYVGFDSKHAEDDNLLEKIKPMLKDMQISKKEVTNE